MQKNNKSIKKIENENTANNNQPPPKEGVVLLYPGQNLGAQGIKDGVITGAAKMQNLLQYYPPKRKYHNDYSKRGNTAGQSVTKNGFLQSQAITPARSRIGRHYYSYEDRKSVV